MAADVVRYRDAVAPDAAAIAALHADSWRRHYRSAYPQSFFDDSLDVDRWSVWTERLASPGGTRTRLAELDGGLVGFVHLRFEDEPEWGCLIDNLHVRHDVQRRGIATHLMRDAAALVVSTTPGQGMHLWVLELNTRARAFYRALGGREGEHRAVGPPAKTGVAGIRVVWPDPAIVATAG